MVRGLYTSALGMRTLMQKMDVIANNIANVNTTGYKKDIVVSQSFSEELMKRLDDPGDTANHDVPIGNVSQGVFVDDIYTSFESGSLEDTEGPLDLAITGRGFFAINVTDQNGNTTEMYTRDGSFTLAAGGTLMTKEGNKVAGLYGNITIPDGNISIDAQGSVYSDGEYIDTIKLVDFEDTHSLRKFKDNLYTTTADSTVKAFGGAVEQGFLEASNVNTVREMVDMITVSRSYETNQRLIQVHDTTMSRAVNDIARR